MKDKIDNPQAFPSDEISQDNISLNCQHQGMTLRDYFAAKAMQGIASNLNNDLDVIYVDVIAKDSYDIADAMLKQRLTNQ